MKSWQYVWLYFILAWSLTHFLRDILQDLGIKTFLSTVLVKQTGYRLPLPWRSLNTYIIEITEIILIIYCLKQNRFGKVGTTTIIIAVITAMSWLYYWFLL